MALIPKVEPKQEKKIVSARLDEEAHTMLQRYAAFLGGATHEYIIGESLKRLFRRDKEFNEWLEKSNGASAATSDAPQPTTPTPKNSQQSATDEARGPSSQSSPERGHPLPHAIRLVRALLCESSLSSRFSDLPPRRRCSLLCFRTV